MSAFGNATVFRGRHGANMRVPGSMVLFDFDGVISDSRVALHAVICDIARRKGVTPPTPAEYGAATIKQLFQRCRVRWYEVPYYVHLARRAFAAQRERLTLHEQIVPTLQWLVSHQEPMGVVSSNTLGVIEYFLAKHVPWAPFQNVVADVPLFAKHRTLTRLRRRHASPAARFLYVGDEVRDIKAAQRAGMPAAAVTWGKDSPDLLRSAAPTYLAQSATELVNIVAAAMALTAASKEDDVGLRPLSTLRD